jgi:flagellar export protein FliJ
MPYQSRLGSVLFQRKLNEDTASREFITQKNLLDVEQERLRSLEQKIGSTLDDLAARQESGGTSEEITLYFRFITMMKEKVEAERKTVLHQEKICEAKRFLLETAVRERKAVETIEKKRKEAYFKEIEKKEQAALDEIGGQLKYRSLGKAK